MKKFNFLAVALVLLMASATSCSKKDGVYAPKKKIHKIYSSTTLTEKVLNEVWNWDGKLLKTIDHYSYSGALSWTETFTYDGNRLTRVEDIEHDEYIVFQYDGNHLQSCNYYSNNQLIYTCAYTYDGKKLSQITFNRYGLFKGEPKMLASVLPLYDELIEVVNEKASKFFVKGQTKDDDPTILNFTWEGNNISQMDMYDTEDTLTMKMEYDEKVNPKQGFMNLNFTYPVESQNSTAGVFASENNVTSTTIKSGDTDYTVSYTYQYDGKYPTVQTIHGDDLISLQASVYYEYEE